jgi:CubicO group peptidase (beta-lactamase class C family)
VVPTSAGLPSDKCEVTEFELDFTVTANYPRWVQREGSEEQVIAAWESFEGLLEAQWEERRRFMVNAAREVRRQVLRLEEPCSLMQQLANRLVRDVFAREAEDERQAIAAGERVRLRWPPEGFEDLLSGQEPAVPGEGSPPGAPAADRRAPARGLAVASMPDLTPRRMMGVAAGIRRGEEVESLEAFGYADPTGEVPLTPDTPFRFPAMTEVVVSAIAASMAASGAVDLHAPLSTYLPELDERLGTVTVADLLAHRSGLDNAAPANSVWALPPDTVWEVILDDLDDRAVFTEPGAIFSHSRYSYPLAARALSRILGEALPSAARRDLFEPLGMEGTSLLQPLEGLPVLETTVPDLLRFWEAWFRGEVGLLPPSPAPGDTGIGGGPQARVYEGGLWWDRVGGQTRLSRMCAAGSEGDAAGFQVFPDSALALVFWSRARNSLYEFPASSVEFLLEELGVHLGLEVDVLEPGRIRGDAEMDTGTRPCDAPTWKSTRPEDLGPPAPAGEWAGRYSNGNRVVELQDREGTLWTAGGMEFPITHIRDDIFLASLAGQPLYPIRLVRDAAGRRYAVLNDRAHLHDGDRGDGR